MINNTATPEASNPVNGTFSNVAQNGTVSLAFNGTTYNFTANYQGGDGNDLVLTNIAGPATHLVVSTQPATATAGSSFALTVTAEDADGNVATSFTGSETIAIASGPSGGTLSGTLAASATGGVATFSGLTLNKAGGYALAARAARAATSDAFDLGDAGCGHAAFDHH